MGWRPERDVTLGVAPFDGDSGLPSWAGMDRGAGAWSRQTAPAVDGQAFVELGTAEDTARFDYDPVSGRQLCLIEPTRQNVLGANANFADANANNVPDNWTANAGVAGVDFECVAGGPHGGRKFRWNDTNVTGRGVYIAAAGAAVFQASARYRRTGTAGQAWARGLYGGAVAAWTDIDLGTTLFDWALKSCSRDCSGGAGLQYFGAMFAQDAHDPPGVVEVALPQAEAGDCVTSFTAGTRAGELLAIDPIVVSRHRGRVAFLWRPDYPSAQALTVDPCLWAWAAGYEILFDPADDKVKVLVAGVKRAETAALTFARQSLIRIGVRYAAAGTQITVSVNGSAPAITSDPTAWGDPGVLAPYLGSRAASVNCRPAAYGDVLLQAA